MIFPSPEVDNWIEELPEERRERIRQLRGWIRKHADPRLEECINYRMIGYVVPRSIYPEGYHCNPGEPLPFLNLGSMKNHVGLYHMGLYADPKAAEVFIDYYKDLMGKKPNMGKSCLRLTWKTEVPEDLIRTWCRAVKAETWIGMYDKSRK